MTQPDSGASERATVTVATASERIASVTARLCHAIKHELTPGEVSQLRRLRPEDPGSTAFWRVVAAYLDPAGVLPAGGEARDEAERHWAAILAGMALTQGLHRHGCRPGRALAAAGYSELRFVRLLRARDMALLDAIRDLAHFLASKAEPVDWLQLVRLVRYQDGEGSESLRRALARDYYGALNQGEH